MFTRPDRPRGGDAGVEVADADEIGGVDDLLEQAGGLGAALDLPADALDRLLHQRLRRCGGRGRRRGVAGDVAAEPVQALGDPLLAVGPGEPARLGERRLVAQPVRGALGDRWAATSRCRSRACW